MNRKELAEKIQNILEEYIYADYNSEIDLSPKARWPEKMIEEIIDILEEAPKT